MSDLAERYGARSATRPAVVAVVVVVAVAALAWLAWVISVQSRPQVTSQLEGFDVRGQHAVTATFVVSRRDEGVRASCLLRAYAGDHAVVGEQHVVVASGGTDQRFTRSVRTERAATTVDLVGCTADGQRSPR